MYQAIYKCRLCNGITNGCCTDSEYTVMTEISNLSIGKHSEQAIYPRTIETHHCKDGSIGAADFQGFKKVGE